jgi:NitT/TauT family transport system ATP-binding protein
MAGAEIRMEAVDKWFVGADGQPLRVLNGLDFSVAGGSLLSLLGPSGCGKSTLLNIIMGLDTVSSGRILIGGKEISKSHHSKDIKIGMVFQQARLLNWRTVRKNVMLPLEARGVPKTEAMDLVDHYLDLVQLKEFGDYYPLQLSGGMQQRVSVARGLVIEPDLLLADEPFASLDEITARKLREEFVRIWQASGTTILFVTHNIREAVFLSSELVMVTPRPASVRLRKSIDVPAPRAYDDQVLFDIEREVTRELIAMEEEAEALKGESGLLT